MADPLEALILDLLESVAPQARSYTEVIGAWRTSCPRLPVWEEALARGLIERRSDAGGALVGLTPAGRELLARERGQ
jgi:D-3-phosphoglycerate dehydrogenase